jgi:hypothetical protein
MAKFAAEKERLQKEALAKRKEAQRKRNEKKNGFGDLNLYDPGGGYDGLGEEEDYEDYNEGSGSDRNRVGNRVVKGKNGKTKGGKSKTRSKDNRDGNFMPGERRLQELEMMAGYQIQQTQQVYGNLGLGGVGGMGMIGNVNMPPFMPNSLSQASVMSASESEFMLRQAQTGDVSIFGDNDS